MTGTKSYYEILELDSSASESDIKKAYRRLALRWHPDKNQNNPKEAEMRFKEISEAYEVLCDKSKREIYDKYGKEGLMRGSGGAGPEFDFDISSFFGGRRGGPANFRFRSPTDIFEEFFGTDNIFDLIDDDMLFSSGSRGNQKKSQRNRNGDVQTNLIQSMFGFPGGNNFGSGFATFSSFSSLGGNGNGHGMMKSTSKSTKMVNGRKYVTTKTVENGVETVVTEEDGVVKSKTVNGVPQSIEYRT